MDIVKIVTIGIISIFLSMTVRAYKPEFGVITALCAAVVLLFLTVPQLFEVMKSINELSENALIDRIYIKSIIKIIGIAYITQFAAELARDANEALLSKKLELAGKISIIAMMMPFIRGIITAVIDTLASF